MTIVSICTKLLDFFPPTPPTLNYLSLYSATLQRKRNFFPPSHKSDIHLPFTLPISKKKKRNTFVHKHTHTHTNEILAMSWSYSIVILYWLYSIVAPPWETLSFFSPNCLVWIVPL